MLSHTLQQIRSSADAQLAETRVIAEQHRAAEMESLNNQIRVESESTRDSMEFSLGEAAEIPGVDFAELLELRTEGLNLAIEPNYAVLNLTYEEFESQERYAVGQNLTIHADLDAVLTNDSYRELAAHIRSEGLTPFILVTERAQAPTYQLIVESTCSYHDAQVSTRPAYILCACLPGSEKKLPLAHGG